ncbi:type II toxin-antitoxin system RatA family toxin [Sphingomonas sp.]|uniref:type II toxin-antitoxin system RatA family toxin n=1 Tax=Sphingomonas sp. TaxID=28214 RepID=UPI002ED8C125
MPKHHEVRHLRYSCEQMFDLVADVKRYAEFLPWVTAMRVRADSATETTADMIVGFKGLRETFTSRVRKQRATAIDVDYVDGPLKYLRNAWRFKPEGEGCAVDFTVDFAFKNRMFEMMAGQVFGIALRKMIGAFEARADQLYGASAGGAERGISSSSAHSAA